MSPWRWLAEENFEIDTILNPRLCQIHYLTLLPPPYMEKGLNLEILVHTVRELRRVLDLTVCIMRNPEPTPPTEVFTDDEEQAAFIEEEIEGGNEEEDTEAVGDADETEGSSNDEGTAALKDDEETSSQSDDEQTAPHITEEETAPPNHDKETTPDIVEDDQSQPVKGIEDFIEAGEDGDMDEARKFIMCPEDEKYSYVFDFWLHIFRVEEDIYHPSTLAFT